MDERFRLRVLPWNPSFKQEAERVRMRFAGFGVPGEGLELDKAREWLRTFRREWVSYLIEEKHLPILPMLLPSDDWPEPEPEHSFFFLERVFANLPDKERFMWKGAIRSHVNANPLRVAAWVLQGQFGLPGSNQLVKAIELYILSGRFESFQDVLWRSAGPTVQVRSDFEAYLDASVRNLDQYTTKSEWVRLWDDRVKPEIEKSFGRVSRRGNRPADPLDRDLTWWQWHKEPGRIQHALQKYLEEHLDEKPYVNLRKSRVDNILYVWALTHPKEPAYSTDAVYDAIQRIESLMRPLYATSESPRQESGE